MSNLLVVLAEVNAKPAWKSVQLTLQKHIPTLSHALVYIDQDKPNGRVRIMLLCTCSLGRSGLSEVLSGISDDIAGTFTTPEFRLYKPTDPPLGIATLNADKTEGLLPNHVLVSVAMTPSLTSDAAFNDWYQREHIPLLQHVPTWASSERFTLDFTTNQEVPQYLALHRWSSMEAFNTEEYRTATNTPWRTTVIAEIIKRERFVVTYEGKLSNLAEKADSA
ncbi:hypothetical protein DXG01_010765 [Tephrocybe rancida]|nr:hypothetical protein DXG01_010765 [Tephrocybe rancida]